MGSKNVRGGERRCTDCGEWKPSTNEYFYRSSGPSTDGFQSRCKICCQSRSREYSKEYHALNRERNNERRKRYSRSKRVGPPKPPRVKYTPEEAKQRARESARRRYAINREHILAKMRVKREKSGAKKWIRKYPDNKTRRRIERQKRRMITDFTPITLTSDEWDYCLSFFGGCCAACGRPPGLWHSLSQDHWTPVSKGGGYSADNIIPLCHGVGGCNQSKCNHDAAEWLEKKFGARKAKRILKRVNDYFEWVRQQKADAA